MRRARTVIAPLGIGLAALCGLRVRPGCAWPDPSTEFQNSIPIARPCAQASQRPVDSLLSPVLPMGVVHAAPCHAKSSSGVMARQRLPMPPACRDALLSSLVSLTAVALVLYRRQPAAN